MNSFFDTITSRIDFIIVAIVLCSGFFQTRYLSGWVWAKNSTQDSALKTLAVSAVASVIYIALVKDPAKGSNYAMYFLSYFFATSLYELLIKPFVNWITLRIGGNK
jgi:hypothetical protein